MYVKVRVHPGEKKDLFVQTKEDSFEVWTKSPAERGLANETVIRILTRHFNKKPRLIKGATSPAKIFEIK